MSFWPWIKEYLRDGLPFFAIGILIGTSLVALFVFLIIAIAGA